MVHPIYAEKPLSVDFELPVGTANNYLTFTQTLAAYLTVAIGIIAAIIFYLRTKRINSIKMYFLWANTFKITFLIHLVFSIVAPMCLKVRNSNVTVLMEIPQKMELFNYFV